MVRKADILFKIISKGMRTKWSNRYATKNSGCAFKTSASSGFPLSKKKQRTQAQGSIAKVIKSLKQPPIKRRRLLIKWTRLLHIRLKEGNIRF